MLRGYMKTISLKIQNSIFKETEKLVSTMEKSRNKYINDALEFYNLAQKRKIIEKKLKKESLLIKTNSMTVLREFEEIE